MWILGLAMCCFLPIIPFFSDTTLLPKWYATLFVLIVWGIYNIRRTPKAETVNLDVNKNIGKTLQPLLYVALAECFYVIAKIAVCGSSSIGEYGTFDNPAGLAFCLCVTLPLISCVPDRERPIRGFNVIAAILILHIVILTKSRTGAICIVLYAIEYTYRHLQRTWLKITVAIALLCSICSYTYYTKKDSTSGRYFILSRSLEMIIDRPLSGWGCGGFNKQYMSFQGDYFKSHPDSKYAILADEVKHPLNEVILLAVDYGVVVATVALLFFILISTILWHKKVSYMIEMSICIGLFSMTSYPFHYPLSWIILFLLVYASAKSCAWVKILKTNNFAAVFQVLLVIFLSLLTIDMYYDIRWNNAYKHSLRVCNHKTLEEYERINTWLRYSGRFLYNYSATAFYALDFVRAYKIAVLCEKQSNTYNLQLLEGDICREGGWYSSAIMHYINAKSMCPSRFSPLEGLYLCYEAKDDSVNMEKIKEEIKRKRVKVASSETLRIKNRF